MAADGSAGMSIRNHTTKFSLMSKRVADSGILNLSETFEFINYLGTIPRKLSRLSLIWVLMATTDQWPTMEHWIVNFEDETDLIGLVRQTMIQKFATGEMATCNHGLQRR
ncbi:unnamed protein product [Caenorhabditis brenneri]